MCGSTKIDGHAFALGLDMFYQKSAIPRCLVTFLMRGAVFRQRRLLLTGNPPSLGVRPLGALVDMYHSQKASNRHDKVYALLGMCSDNRQSDTLQPNYTTPWDTLMAQLVTSILGDQASVQAFDDKEAAIIECKGSVLGRVGRRESNSDKQKIFGKMGERESNAGKQQIRGRVGKEESDSGKQNIEVIWSSTIASWHIFPRAEMWTLEASAKLIQDGDIVCLLRGSSKPTIIRAQETHFTVIAIAAIPEEYTDTHYMRLDSLQILQNPQDTRDFFLIWDWEASAGN